MLSFFASIRMTLASTSVIGETAIEYIRSIFIPNLSSRLEKSETEDEQDKLSKALELWKKYSDKKHPEWKFWDNIGMGQIWSAAKKYNYSNSDVADEAAAAIVEELFIRGHFDRIFARYDPIAGPLAFASFWKTIWGRRALMYFRDQRNKQPRVVYYDDKGEPRKIPVAPISLYDTKSEDDRNLLQTLKAPQGDPDEDLQFLQELKHDMDGYIAQKFGDNKLTMDVYKQWMRAAEKQHGKNINFIRDIWTPLQAKYKKSGKTLPRVTATRHYKLLASEIVHFFERVEGKRLSNTVKKRLNLTARVALAEYHQSFATWMLAPYRAGRNALAGIV